MTKVDVHIKDEARPLVIQQVTTIVDTGPWLEVRTANNEVYKIMRSEIKWVVEGP